MKRQKGKGADMDKKLNTLLRQRQESGYPHPPYAEERMFYDLIASGDVEGIDALAEKYSETRAGAPQKGVLSDNPVRNAIYHLVANCTIMTRRCISAGMPQEQAFNLSDIFIRRADGCRSVKEVYAVNDEMAREFAVRMKALKEAADYSALVRRAVIYIRDNLHEKLTVTKVAAAAGCNRSYLAELFRKETKDSISGFIAKARIAAAKEMIDAGMSLSEVSSSLNYATQSHFCKRFREFTGMTPLEYKRRIKEDIY